MLGMDPFCGSSDRVPLLFRSGEKPRFTYSYREDVLHRVSFQVQWSNDMETWYELHTLGYEEEALGDALRIGAPSNNGDGTYTVTIEPIFDSSVYPCQFFRIVLIE